MIATDAAGNVSEASESASVEVDLTPPPAPVILSPLDGAVIGDLRPVLTGTSERFSRVVLRLNDAELGEAGADGDGGWSLEPGEDLALREHELAVFAVDAAGNESERAITRFTIDPDADELTPPDSIVDAGPAEVSDSTDATFTFSCTDAGCTFECSLDGDVFALCASPRAYFGLDEGPHSFRVRATDAWGNADPTPANRSWTILLPGACGDGALDEGEACDDGDAVDGDGCSAACEPEARYACAGEPSVCVLEQAHDDAGGTEVAFPPGGR